MAWRGACRAILVGAALLGLWTAATAAPAPRRVVSLNPCLDAILLDVADPDQIVALSHYSRDPSQSAVADRARRFAFTWGSAEEVVALRPDLVLGASMGGMALTAELPRLGVREASFGVPSTVNESLAQVRRVAQLVGHADRGEALIAEIRAAIAHAALRPGEPRLGALIYEYHGIASGPGTLMDELMRDAGFDNLARRYGLKRTGDVPLEAVMADPPQVLLAGHPAANEPVWADRILSNPALAALAPHVRRETFPETLMFCGGPVMIPAIEALARARERALQGISQ